MEATRVFILAIAPIEIFDDEEFFAHDEVVTNKHARDGAKKTGVADEPNKNVIGVVRHQLPWLHDDAHGAGDETAGAETDAARGEIGEIVGRGDDVGGDVDVEGGHEKRNHRQDDGEGIAEARKNRDGIPKRLAKDDHGGGSYGDADEGVESHRGGEAKSLADDLITLAACIPREVGNVQRDGGPETDDAGERRNKEAEEFAKGLKFRWRGEHGAEAARFAARPEEKSESNQEQKRSGNSLQEADGFDAAENHQHVEEPEESEADRRTGMKVCPRRGEGHDHGVDRFAADPGLNAKPAAGDKSTQDGGDVGAENAEGSTSENRKRDTVLRARMGVQKHGDQHKEVAEKNGEERLLPVHAAGDHAAGEHVGGNVHAHGNPQGGVVVSAPSAALARDRSEILVVERTALDGFRAKQFSLPPRSFPPRESVLFRRRIPGGGHDRTARYHELFEFRQDSNPRRAIHPCRGWLASQFFLADRRSSSCHKIRRSSTEPPCQRG